MKRLNATQLGWLLKADSIAHYFYTLTFAMSEKRDSRLEQVTALMAKQERETVREAYDK